jgi:hypothetical protein
MLIGCKKINNFWHALELSQDKESEKKNSFAFCKYVNHLKHINANKHFVLLNVFKYNRFAECYILCNLLKECIKNENSYSTEISHRVAKKMKK